MINKVVYKLGSKLFNSKIDESYLLLKRGESLSREQLEDFQYSQCVELIERAYNGSEFYRAKMDSAGVGPEDFKSLDDIVKFPVLTKEELRENVKMIQCYEGISGTKKAQTSGTSGQSLVFQRDNEWDARNRAAILRGYSWYGVNPWDKNGYFWGYSIDKSKVLKIKILDFLQNRFRAFKYDGVEFERFITKLKKATFLEGYSSAIYQTAKIINKKGLSGQFSNIKMVKGTSEKIFDKYQIEVEKAFGVKMISEYGSTEAGIIAFECPMGHMHITSENVLIEEIDGEILVTNLVSKSLPIIRYKLGDYVELDRDTVCECGMVHPIIKNVLGRVGKNIYGKESIYPSLYIYYIFKNISAKGIALNFQCIQEQKGKLVVNIGGDLNENEKKLINSEAVKYFKDDLEIEINANAEILRDGGKLKDFISKID